MRYATLADMIARYGHKEIAELSAADGFATYGGTPDINAVRIALALDDANSEVHGYVGTRIRVPVSDPELPPPAPHPLLVRLACDIARYRLYDDAAPEEVHARYVDATRILERIAGGTITLGSTLESTPSHPQKVYMQACRQVFGRRHKRGGMR